MALLFVDGFDHYNQQVKFDQKWTGHFSASSVPSFVTGRWGYGQAMRYNNGTNASEFKWTANLTTYILGGAFRVADLHGAGVVQAGATFRGVSLFHTYTGHSGVPLNASIQNGVAVDGEGRLLVFTGVLATIIGTSAASLIRNNAWNYIELKMTTHASAGAFTLKCNGVTVASGSGIQTTSGANPNSIDAIGLGNIAMGNVDTDDVYLCDTTGSVNNDFLGDIDVRTQFPNSDSSIQWTKNTGATNAAAVGENPVDDATSYVEDITVGHKDFYGMPALASGGGAAASAVKAVAVTSRAAKTDTINRTCRANLKSSSSTGNGATITPRVDYDWQQDIFETDPNGAIAWTETTVNAATPGVEIVS